MRNQKTVITVIAALLLIVFVGALVNWALNAKGPSSSAKVEATGGKMLTKTTTGTAADTANKTAAAPEKFRIELTALPSYKLVNGENTVINLDLKTNGVDVRFTKAEKHQMNFALQTDALMDGKSICGLYEGGKNELASVNPLSDGKGQYKLNFEIGKFAAGDTGAQSGQDLLLKSDDKVAVEVRCPFAGVVKGNTAQANLLSIDFGQGKEAHLDKLPGMIFPVNGFRFAAP